MGRLDGKVAIVTGAARGQGEAEGRLFAAEGAKVVMGDVLDDLGQAVADEIGESARYVHLDVSNAECLARVRVRNASGAHEFVLSDAQFEQFTAYFEPPAEDEGFNVVVHGGD